MATILDGEVTSLALCWRLERSDGAGLALTSHDRAFVLDGEPLEPAPGIVPSAVSRSVGLSPHTSEVSGGLTSSALDEADLALGRWDNARAVLSAVDWGDPAADEVRLLQGELGSVETTDAGFTAELNGAAAALQRPVCPATSPQCRAEFGDAACRVDLRGRTLRAAVVDGGGTAMTLDEAVDDRFLFGRLRFLSGANCGLASIILAVEGTTVRVRDVPRAVVEAGCRIELREGCDKTFATCRARFGNAVNFRGEPHLPGTDLLTRYPGA